MQVLKVVGKFLNDFRFASGRKVQSHQLFFDPPVSSQAFSTPVIRLTAPTNIRQL